MKMLKQFIKGSFLMNIIETFRLFKFRRKWRKINSENKTTVNNVFDHEIVYVGKNTYGELNVVTFRNITKLFIGNFCSIGQNVNFIMDAGHVLNNISTYPFKVAILGSKNGEAISKGDIIVDDDVWIGFGATVLSGVHIGQGAVIAAGSIVTKDVPPYAIVGGIPAKIIKYRFSQEIIDELMKIDYSKLTDKMVKVHINDLYSALKDVSQLDWMPKK